MTWTRSFTLFHLIRPEGKQIDVRAATASDVPPRTHEQLVVPLGPAPNSRWIALVPPDRVAECSGRNEQRNKRLCFRSPAIPMTACRSGPLGGNSYAK